MKLIRIGDTPINDFFIEGIKSGDITFEVYQPEPKEWPSVSDTPTGYFCEGIEITHPCGISLEVFEPINIEEAWEVITGICINEGKLTITLLDGGKIPFEIERSKSNEDGSFTFEVKQNPDCKSIKKINIKGMKL